MFYLDELAAMAEINVLSAEVIAKALPSLPTERSVVLSPVGGATFELLITQRKQFNGTPVTLAQEFLVDWTEVGEEVGFVIQPNAAENFNVYLSGASLDVESDTAHNEALRQFKAHFPALNPQVVLDEHVAGLKADGLAYDDMMNDWFHNYMHKSVA